MRSYFNGDAAQQSPGKTGGWAESSLHLFEVSAARPAAESVIRLHVHSLRALPPRWVRIIQVAAGT